MLHRFDITSVGRSLTLVLKSVGRRLKNCGRNAKQLPWKEYRHRVHLIVRRLGQYILIALSRVVSAMKSVGETILLGIGKLRKRGKEIPGEDPSPPVDTGGGEGQTDAPDTESVISQEIEALLKDRLPTVMRALNQCCQEVESDFFSIGDELQFLYSETNRLAEGAAEAVQEGGDESPGVKLSEIVQRARNLLAILDDDHVVIASNLEHIGSIVQRLGRLLDYSTVIKKLGKTLRMIGLNISIESARNLEAHDIFNDLALQIRELSQVVSLAAADIQQDTETSQYNLADLHRNMDVSFNQLKTVSATAQNAMGQAVPEVEKIVGLSTDVLSQTRDQSQQISQQVGRIVMDVQLHDSVSQRIEHVGLALIEAHVTLLSTCRAKDDAKTDSELVCAYFILKIQAAQVEKIVDEIREIHNSTSNAFHQIKDGISALLESLQMLDSDSRYSSMVIRTDNNPIETLKTIFFKLSELIEQAAQEMERADKATHDSKGTAECLAQHAQKIRDFNFDIHLKALNAIASSLRLGSKGRTIEVLVQDMKDLAIKSNEFVVQIESVIEEIISQSSSLQTRVNETDGGDAGDGPDMAQLVDTFSTVCSRFESGVSMALELGTTLNRRIDEVHSHLMFLQRFADEMAMSLEELESLIDDLKPFVNEDLMNPEEIHEQLIKRYTTQQERDIHDRILNCGKASGETDAGGEMEDCELFGDNNEACGVGDESDSDAAEDFGENIELF